MGELSVGECVITSLCDPGSNIQQVSTETKHYHETISAYHRLLDLKEKFCDVEVNYVICK